MRFARWCVPVRAVKALSLLACPELTTAGGFSAYAGLPESVGKKQARRLSVRLKSEGLETHIPVEEWESASPGSVAAVIFRQPGAAAVLWAGRTGQAGGSRRR